MARRSDTPNVAHLDRTVGVGVDILRAQRAQSLSWMRLVEQSLRALADAQRAAALVRDTATVYRLATSHLGA
jgi:hypothetical protein